VIEFLFLFLADALVPIPRHGSAGAALGKARRRKKQGRTVLHRSRAQGREARAQAGACWPGCRRREGRRSGCAQAGEKRHGRDGSILWCASSGTRPGGAQRESGDAQAQGTAAQQGHAGLGAQRAGGGRGCTGG
jgi:hypothetical protein